MGIIAQLFDKGKHRRHQQEVDRLYELYKQPFIAYLNKYYGTDPETARDLYQESFADLCQNVREGKYTEREASLKSYLFGIGKRKACNRLRSDKRQTDDAPNLFSEWIAANETSHEWIQAQEVTAQLVQEAEESCRRVLTLFYWERLPMTEIARRMNYKDADVAKNKKSSCLRRLSFELQKRLESIDIHWKRKERK